MKLKTWRELNWDWRELIALKNLRTRAEETRQATLRREKEDDYCYCSWSRKKRRTLFEGEGGEGEEGERVRE